MAQNTQAATVLHPSLKAIATAFRTLSAADRAAIKTAVLAKPASHAAALKGASTALNTLATATTLTGEGVAQEELVYKNAGVAIASGLPIPEDDELVKHAYHV